jgi:tyrosyl-tRNA synthetase
MAAKKTLGRDIVSFYYGSDAAAAAQAEWEKQFSQKQDPDVIPEAPVSRSELVDGRMGICKLLVAAGMVKSNNEARRLLGPNSGVTIGPDREKITDPNATVAVSDGLVVRVGSRRIVRVRLQ